MEVSVTLEISTLLAAWIWACTENVRVKVSCSMDWVMVSVSPCAYRNWYIFADELYLGSGCPMTRIQTYVYDFIYPAYECGIRIKIVSEEALLLQTERHFNPRHTRYSPQKTPLECSASRRVQKSVWLMPVSTENEIKLDPSPFIADFKTTPEELGLLNSSQTDPILNLKLPPRPQMASQEVDRIEPGAACAGDAPRSQGGAAGEDSSAYRPLGRSQNHPEVLQVLGAVQILNAAVILALGGFIHSLQNFPQPSDYLFFSIVHTGFYIWGAIFFLVSGILAVSAGKKPTKTLLETSFGMHISSAAIAIVGTVYLSMNLYALELLLNGCQLSQPPDLCIYMEASSTGLVSLMLVLVLLELCIACSVAVLWLKANCCHLRKAISSFPDPGESRMPPNESKEIQS
ncbi:unnamed protein product [Rangifer tarandus platyrhynchus]|uniref:Uncharacterized protein n=2 Tax=Rangifer tarandus platyrhynchus TaxID=3082113 RepID=A0ABN8XXL1_RANTA|nr:unnamed protein product [Rangifer tarandus platyrhynchus]